LVSRNLIRNLLTLAPCLLRFLLISRLLLGELNLASTVPEVLEGLNWKPAHLSASLLVCCCCVSGSSVPNPSELFKICVANAREAAPYAPLLFGLLVQKSKAFISQASYFDAFAPLVQSDREEVRAAAVFALGCVRDARAIEPLVGMIVDPADLVSSEAVVALALAIRVDLSQLVLPDGLIQKMRQNLVKQGERSEGFRKCYEPVKDALERFMARMEGRQVVEQAGTIVRSLPCGRLPALLRHSIRAPGLVERFAGNIFNVN
jgi:hypothetical protein